MKQENKGKIGGRAAIVSVALFVVAVIAVVMFVLLVYTKGLRESTIESTFSYMKSTAVCTADSAYNYFDGNLSALEYCAAGLYDAQTISEDEITQRLVQYTNKSIFDAAAYIDEDNNVITYDGKELKAGTRLLARQAMTNGRAMRSASEDRSDIDLYAVSVYSDDGSVIGAVVASTKLAELTDRYCTMIDVSGAIYVVDIDGDVIHLNTDERGPFVSGDNVVSMLENNGNAVNTLKTSLLQTDVSGVFRATVSGVEYIVSYASINAFDWTVLSTVPVSAVIGRVNANMQNTVYLVAGIVIVFLMLAAYVVYYTRHLQKQARLAIEDSHKMYYEDSITGFPSWQVFVDSYENRMKDTSANYAFLSLDIDKFKAVNDTLGFDGGNEILRRTAEIIGRNLGKDDLFARNSGDLFYILAEYKTKDDLTELVNHIMTDIDYQITEVKIFISIGIYQLTDRNMKIRAAADRADLARKSIKIMKESAYSFFDVSMIEDIRNEKSIEDVMEAALEKHEFKVFLQPKFGLDSKNEVIGAEALVRWFHDGEIVPPGKFIPLFEKNGFVTKLDFYMFSEVCKLQKSWLSQGYEPKVISVNMSRLHLHNDDFVQTLSNYCKEYDIDPKYFEIEITESAAYENIDILMDIFRQIKAAGFHVSIDDFGTGYSSLNMLKDLPVDVLKIDRSFLTENADETENASKIIGCVVSLASSLNISTICEGIETKEQAYLLKKLGCDMAQGFYFARPMPVAEYEKMVYNIERKE